MQDQKRATILYIITKGNAGGAQRYVKDLAINLDQAKFRPVVAMGEVGALQKDLAQASIETRQIPSLSRDVSILNDFKSIYHLYALIKKERPAIVHLNSSKAGFVGSIAARLYSITHRFSASYKPLSIIFTAHGWPFNESRPFMERSFFSLLSYMIVLLSHKTIAVSKKTAADSMHFPLIHKKILVIQNGIAPIPLQDCVSARKELCHHNHDLLTQSTREPGAIWVGCPAELHKNKGIDILLDALAQMQETTPIFTIIAGEGEERKSLELKIKNLNLPRVFLTGYIPNIASKLLAFDIVVIPSRTEALPYAVLEAGMAKRPLIATNVGGIPEITGKEGAYLIAKENAGELTGALEEVSRQREKRDTMGAALYKSVSTNFTLKAMIEKTVALYERR